MGMLTHHEKRAEIHPPQYRILHLGNLEKYSQKLLFSLQACQKCGGRSLKIRFMLELLKLCTFNILSCLETLFTCSLWGISMYGDGLTECTLQIEWDNKSKLLPPRVSEQVLIIVLRCQALTDAPPHKAPWHLQCRLSRIFTWERVGNCVSQ